MKLTSIVASIAAAVIAITTVTATSDVPKITAADFYALRAGREPTTLCPTATSCGYGLWAVRFSLPWDTLAQSSKEAAVVGDVFLNDAAKLKGIAGYAEFVLDAKSMTIADVLGLATLPSTVVVTRTATRAYVPKGSQVSERPVWAKVVLDATKDFKDANALYRAVLEHLPANYADTYTFAVKPSVQFANSIDELQTIAKNASRADPTATTLTAFAFDGWQSPAALAQVQAVVSHAAFVGRRSAPVVIIDTSRGRLDGEFAALHPTSPGTFTVAHISLGDTSNGHAVRGKFGARGLPSHTRGKADFLAPRNVIVEGAFPLGSADAARVLLKGSSDGKRTLRTVYSPEDEQAWLTQTVVVPAHTSISHFAQGNPSYLRKLHSAEQFHREVIEMRSGVSVVALVRESDPFFSGQLKAARELAVLAAKDTKATIQERRQDINFDVMMADAEVHPNLAKAFKAKEVPSIVFILSLQNGQKGVRHFKGDMKNAKAVNKFMREELFDGREMFVLDENDIDFSEKSPVHKADLPAASRTYVWTLNPRRYSPADAPKEPPRALREIIEAASTASSDSKVSKTKTKKNQANLSDKEKKKAEKEAEEQEKIKEELERKKREKEERIRKKAEEQKAAEEKAREVNAKAAEERKKAAKEAAAKAPKVPKVKAKPQAPPKAPTDAKPKPPKPPRDPKVLQKLWEKDARDGAKASIVKHTDGTIEVLDKML